ncbi:serine/threonine protein kinase, partial [Streptomyces montanus]
PGATPGAPGPWAGPETPGAPAGAGQGGAPALGGSPPQRASYTPTTAAPAPHTPQTPHTAQTPHTPGAPSGADSWQGSGSRSRYEPANPYASDPFPPYAGAGSAASYAGGPPGQSGSDGGSPGGGGGAGGDGPLGGRRRKFPAWAVVAIVVAVVLAVGGGAWAVVGLGGDDDKKAKSGGEKSASPSKPEPSPTATGPVYPYGERVGLTDPLKAGDCVKAVWSGAPFTSEPNLGVVDCGEDWPDGQVVAVDTATDYADARAEGARRCERQAQATADALPDAGVYAVTPTKQGFGTAEGGTACLVLGRHAAIGGEVGRFRDGGTELWVGQMSIGDCWIYNEQKDGYKAPLTDCAKPHTDQVIGVVRAPANMDHKKGVDNANKLCGNKFESTWAPGPDRTVYGWVADKDDWNDGFSKAVCTVSRTDGEKTSGKISTPGTV